MEPEKKKKKKKKKKKDNKNMTVSRIQGKYTQVSENSNLAYILKICELILNNHPFEGFELLFLHKFQFS
jgi:hypothetical protein